MQTSKEISLYFGKSEKWISFVKCRYKDKYKRLTSFSENIYNSITKYIQHYEDIREELSKIFYKIDSSEWYELVFKAKIYTRKQNVYKFDTIVFSTIEPLDCQYTNLEKMEKVLKYYKDNYYVI